MTRGNDPTSSIGTLNPLAGVDFPELDGARASTSSVRAIVAAAADAVDPALASTVRASPNWRTDYLEFFHSLTAAAAAPTDAANNMAHAGLDCLGRTMVFGRGRTTTTLDAVWDRDWAPAETFTTGRVVGGSSPVTELVIPYRGRDLTGSDLSTQLDRWTDDGIVEPSFANSIREVMAHPQWLSLPGHRVALIGAGSEMGPLLPLMRWGAHVLAVDIPRPAMWNTMSMRRPTVPGRRSFRSPPMEPSE